MTMVMVTMMMMILVVMITTYDDDDYEDDDYDADDDYDDGIVGSRVQVLEAATNTAACTPASAADPRGSATNPWFPAPANTPRTV